MNQQRRRKAVAIQALNQVCEYAWVRPHIERALLHADPTEGKTYWDWRDSPSDSFYAYVVELNGQILYVGQTARGADSRVRDHRHPAANTNVVRRFGFIQELARISVRNRNQAIGLENELWREFDMHGYMVTTGRKPKPRPDFEWLPHNRPADPPQSPPPRPPEPLDPDDYYRIGLEFLWHRSQGSGDGQGLRINRYASVTGLLSRDEWADSDRHLAWKVLSEHPKQLQLCADLEGQGLPPAPRPAYPSVIVTLQGQDLRFGGRGVHPTLTRIQREHGASRHDESGRLLVRLDGKVAAYLREVAGINPDIHFDENVLKVLAEAYR